MNSRWKKFFLYASLIIIGGGLIYLLLQTVRAKNTGFETKTLWDWMELLIIPLVLAGGAFFLNRSEQETERESAEERAKVDRQLAENRIKEDRQIEEERAKLGREINLDHQREATLQSYLDRISNLLLKENLRTSENSEVRNVARILTLSALPTLDAQRKKFVVRFLYEAGLINNKKTVVGLSGADLSEADLEHVNLHDVNLSGARLYKAHLVESKLNW